MEVSLARIIPVTVTKLKINDTSREYARFYVRAFIGVYLKRQANELIRVIRGSPGLSEACAVEFHNLRLVYLRTYDMYLATSI